jgi:NAD(P)-dependent dehydrogenase (short-subunit alcohol dehydrogenase family)
MPSHPEWAADPAAHKESTMTNTRSTTLVPTMLAAIALMVPAMLAAGTIGATERVTASQTVLITGANRGLGLEFARQYAEAGWSVIGTARTPDKATELKALGVRVMQLDVADAGSVERLATDLADLPIDLLVNNAGIANRDGMSFESLGFDGVERVLSVNTIGPMRVTRALLPNLRLGRAKQIVSITSGLGSIEENTSGGYYGYRESKAALNMFNRSLAAELGDEGFTCVVMSPGWVKTDMGGPDADLSPAESITGMRKVIAGLTPEDSGSFQRYDGTTMPW